MKALLTVVIPVYNVEKYLDRCVNSVVNQTLKNLEIVLVDDESPDNCPMLCDEWAKKDARIKVIHKKNGGLGYARNSGIEVATGDYITFLDSDDYMDLKAYEIVTSHAIEKNLDVCYFKHRRITKDNKKIEVSKEKSAYIFEGKEEIKRFMMDMIGEDPTTERTSPFSMSVCMGIFRLSTIMQSGIRFVSEREVASEDLIFHMNYLKHINKICVLPYVFYNYYINPNSITMTFNYGKYQRLIKLLYVVKDELLKDFTWDVIRIHYYSQQLRIIKVVLRYASKSNYSIKEKKNYIKKLCEEKILVEILHDSIIDKFPFFDRCIIFLMRNKNIIPMILVYKFLK